MKRLSVDHQYIKSCKLGAESRALEVELANPGLLFFNSCQEAWKYLKHRNLNMKNLENKLVLGH